ncbi:uncharacterized protein MONBRDRAFT_32315 [Monosiga brevicollis MX1]|uniref:Uncharacterized protein n=1 Tax=Monosiga brevicollis TaxID=81824 RepID=A9UYR4_MONBE|nr:uncharacterized protein MONBRDRAFT_32315 [Monosiga brevicollis MX1]EDQ89651.1 predicted protein [Monosiga brevicollis MX1]|eukprot:XP_001745680.1 hypothetical protein [Monosiga brevicollis MX1]
MAYDALVRVIMVGDSTVGKSSMAARYSRNEFYEQAISTIGVDFVLKTMQVDSKTIKMQVWDTAGQERFRSITHSYYRGADAVLVVYDITNADSVDSLSGWVERARAHAKVDVAIFIIGNKFDLYDPADPQQVTNVSQAQHLARKLGLHHFVASAKSDINVQDIFLQAARDIMRVREEARQPTPLVNVASSQPASSSWCTLL